MAIALSRGGAAKTYEHQDPNEDACAFAWTDHASLVAVADGHWGSGGAELALSRLLDRHAPRWTSAGAIALADRWFLEAPDVALDLNHTLVAAGGPEAIGRTTLALALARPREGWWAALLVGDSHLFTADVARVSEPCRAVPGDVRFIGDPKLDRASLERGLRCAVERAAPRAIVLATDGLSEPAIGVENPARAVAESVGAARGMRAELRPLETARGLAERALAAQRSNAAGDNVAAACIWSGD